MRTGFKLSAANAAVQYQPKQNKIKHWSYYFKNPATQLLRPLYSSTFSALLCAMFTVAKGSIPKKWLSSSSYFRCFSSFSYSSCFCSCSFFSSCSSSRLISYSSSCPTFNNLIILIILIIFSSTYQILLRHLHQDLTYISNEHITLRGYAEVYMTHASFSSAP